MPGTRAQIVTKSLYEVNIVKNVNFINNTSRLRGRVVHKYFLKKSLNFKHYGGKQKNQMYQRVFSVFLINNLSFLYWFNNIIQNCLSHANCFLDNAFVEVHFYLIKFIYVTKKLQSFMLRAGREREKSGSLIQICYLFAPWITSFISRHNQKDNIFILF